MTCQEQIRLIIARYVEEDHPIPYFSTSGEYAHFYSDRIVKNCRVISEYFPQFVKPSINDIDLIVVIRLLTNALSNHKYFVRTLAFCANILSLILNGESPFLKTLHFVNLLRTDIHNALLSLALDSHFHRADKAACLIIIVWRNFAT
jgi:hypothetical protein